MNNNIMTNTKNGYRTVIKASAGTGKTYRLSLEYIANLLSGINYENIVVMTFTKKATAEIKDRIFEFIEDIAYEKNDYIGLEKSIKDVYGIDKIDKLFLKNAYLEMIKNKDDIRIFTIDGFLNQIFKNAISPYMGIYGYETLDMNDESFYSDVLITLFKNNEYMKMFEFLFEEIKDTKNIDSYISVIEEIVKNRFAFSMLKSSNMKKNKNDKYTNVGFVNKLDDILNIINAVSINKNKEISKLIKTDFIKIYNKYLELKEKSDNQIDVFEHKKDLIIENYKLFLTKELQNRSGLGKTSEEVEEIENIYENFCEELSLYIYHTNLIPLQNKILELSEIIFNICDEKKVIEKKLTYDDISNYTHEFIYNEELGFIKDNKVTETFLELIGGKIETMMIDEFQDTSILQWRILKLMMNSAKNVICVGDEKQSIYGWRGGEKELFSNLDTLINANVEELDRSYRSYKKIIETVNEIFVDIDENWRYNEVKYRNDEEYQSGYFAYCIKKQKIKSKNDDEDFENETSIDNIIEVIETNKIKNIGNACIIGRKNTHLNEIARKLNKKNIAYTINSSASLLDHEAIKSIYQFIKYLSTNNSIYLFNFLRSDLLNYTNEDIRYYIQNIDNLAVILESDKIKDKELLSYIMEMKERIDKLNNINSFEDIGRELINKFELTKKYDTQNDIKNIFKFFNIMKDYKNIQEFVSYIDENAEKITQLSSEENNAINIMTIHKSKGLEYETVFFYNKIGRGGGNSNTSKLKIYIAYDENYNDLQTFFVTLSKYSKVLNYIKNIKEVEETLDNKMLLEDYNNIYVALTRAKKNLFINLDVFSNQKDEIKDVLTNRLINIYGSEIEYEIGQISEKELIENNIEQIKYDDKLFDYLNNTDYKKIQINERGLKLKLENEYKRKLGLAVHYYLEQIKTNVEEDMKKAKSMLLLRYGNLVGPKKIEEIMERTNKFIENNLYIYDKKYQVYNEFEIMDESNNKKIVDRINIDEKNKKIYIYYFKTGYEAEKNEKYLIQLEEYKKILLNKTNGNYEIETKILEV